MQYEKIYKLTQRERYSDIIELEANKTDKVDCVVTNPPYSLRWKQSNNMDPRFLGFGMPPKKAADYAFLLHGLHALNEGGTLIAIVPHGVLFRSGAEGIIRQQLITRNLIDGIIGLPDNLFLYTSIPVCIMIIKNKKSDQSVMFIDSSREFEKGGKQNYLTAQHIEKIVNTYKRRQKVEKYARLVNYQEIESNGYNLNIPRYVDTFEPEPIPDIQETIQNIVNIETEIRSLNKEIYGMMKELVAQDAAKSAELDHAIHMWGEIL